MLNYVHSELYWLFIEYNNVKERGMGEVKFKLLIKVNSYLLNILFIVIFFQKIQLTLPSWYVCVNLILNEIG